MIDFIGKVVLYIFFTLGVGYFSSDEGDRTDFWNSAWLAGIGFFIAMIPTP